MQSLEFNEGYYSGKYSSSNPQLTVKGVGYNNGGLEFSFSDNFENVYRKSSNNALEQHILTDIIKGSKLWKYKASVSDYIGYNGSIRKVVSINVDVDDSFVNTYKEDISFKIFLSK